MKKHGKSLGSKKNEKISLHERSETNCSFIGKPKADIDGGQRGREKENTVERAVSTHTKSQKDKIINRFALRVLNRTDSKTVDGSATLIARFTVCQITVLSLNH